MHPFPQVQVRKWGSLMVFRWDIQTTQSTKPYGRGKLPVLTSPCSYDHHMSTYQGTEKVKISSREKGGVGLASPPGKGMTENKGVPLSWVSEILPGHLQCQSPWQGPHTRWLGRIWNMKPDAGSHSSLAPSQIQPRAHRFLFLSLSFPVYKLRGMD